MLVPNDRLRTERLTEQRVSIVDRSEIRPALVYLKLFDNCNLRCQMCDCWELPRARLDSNHVDAVLTSVLTARPHAIRFTGGEPLLYKDLASLVRRTANQGSRPVLISNGRILDRHIGSLLSAGLSELIVSVDGPEPVHDSIRGLPSLGGLRKGLKLLRDPVVFGVNTVVQRMNVDHLNETLDLLLDLPVVPSWWHLIPVRGGVHGVRKEDQGRAATAVDEIMARAHSEGVEVVATPKMFTENAAPCLVPQFMVYVNAVDGSVYGCNMLAYADSAVGNVLEQPLSAVLQGALLAGVQSECARGAHPTCSRCDPSSRQMNQSFRSRYA